MKNYKDYIKAKKEFIKVKNLNSDNIYNEFRNEKEILLLQRYYELYSQFLFQKLIGSLRLEVDSQKRDKLIKLKGEGTWKFAGMVDMFSKENAKCELGHSIRYVYKAVNEQNGQMLSFGFRCVGDFFDLDENSVKALEKLKDTMFSELKEIVSVFSLNLWEEHYYYDCQALGIIIKNFGEQGITKLLDINPLMSVILDFVKLNLPLPNSLLTEILKYNNHFKNIVASPEFLGLNKENLDILRNSEITLISQIFTYSFEDIVKNLSSQHSLSNVSDFYNFRTIKDMEIAVSHWVNRNDRLIKAQNYFRNQGISSKWIDIYRYMINNRLYHDNPKMYYGIETLLVFDKGITIESSVNMPKDYGYKGYQLSPKAHENFDFIIDYMTTKEFFMCIREIEQILKAQENEEKKVIQQEIDMMTYLRSHLEDEKYKNIKGILGVCDIVLNKKLEIENMSSRQLSYVKSIYNIMQNIDKNENNFNNSLNAGEINNRYTLVEKPDILNKIQRLQHEVDNLPNMIDGIFTTVMKTKFITDKQIIQIEKAFSKYILKEENTEVVNTQTFSQNKNKKWSLFERPDIKEKILNLKRHSEYINIPQTIQSIFDNILKYNTVSDKQIEVVENTYKRHFGGK